MTVIAVRGRTMAADKKSTYFGTGVTTTKIRKTADGCLLGCAGEGGMCRELVAWWRDGAAKDSYPDRNQKSLMLVLFSDGKIFLYDGSPEPIVIEDEFFAIGSGKDAALAAMHLGHGAHRAVEVACQVEDGCGRGIDVLSLDD